MALYKLEAFPPPDMQTVLCLGMFDGVHVGHQKLIEATCLIARDQHLLPCAFTFDLPPAAVLNPSKHTSVLTGIEEKSALLHQYGLSHVIYAHFDPAIAHLSACTFFEEILLHRLHAGHLVIGFHYHFGHQAEGDADMLKALCDEHHIGLTILPPVTLPDGTLISSTAIRQSLENGNPDTAEKMLGRPVKAISPFQFGGIDHA